MANYDLSKSGPGREFPDDGVQNSWQSVEPLVTPVKVRTRFLFGIPLVSAMKDPVTNKNQVYTDDILRDTIDRAVALAEAETGLTIFPLQVKEKQPFDRQEYESFGYMRTKRRPVASVEELAIVPPSGTNIYNVPLEWVETAYLPNGQINLIPLGNAIAYGTPANVGSGGALFLNVLGSQPWIPAFWQLTYTAGFVDGALPKVVNELIGCIAAMEVLSQLGPTWARMQSHSLGIDGLSQSIGTSGPQVFKLRFDDLAQKRQQLVRKIKSQFGLVLFSGNV